MLPDFLVVTSGVVNCRGRFFGRVLQELVPLPLIQVPLSRDSFVIGAFRKWFRPAELERLDVLASSVDAEPHTAVRAPRSHFEAEISDQGCKVRVAEDIIKQRASG